jgi:hypothetical protein
MGLGGHLLWTSVIRSLHEESGRRVRVCHRPMVSDLVAGRLYRGEVSLAEDPVFHGNPRIEFPPLVEKSSWALRADRAVDAAIRRLGLAGVYERLVLALSKARTRRLGSLDAHIDLQRHSYVLRETRERMVWKKGGHIIDIILANYGVRARDHRCEMYFSEAEEREVTAICKTFGIGDEFVVIEPNSKDTWFGDLRAWPIDRWQAVLERVAAGGRYQVVQVGEGGGHELRDAINLSGRIPVRLAICLMKRARLFLGLEGGLMHAANAAGVAAVIVWGGLTLPDFAGYREMHRVLCTYVECAPCGLRGGCPYSKKCLTGIPVDDVVDAVRQSLPGAFARVEPASS